MDSFKITDIFVLGIKGLIVAILTMFVVYVFVGLWFIAIPLLAFLLAYLNERIINHRKNKGGTHNGVEIPKQRSSNMSQSTNTNYNIGPKSKKTKEQPFVTNVKNMVTNKTGYDIIWPDDVDSKIINKQNFIAYINNAIIKTPFVVHMDNEGARKITFPNESFDTIYFKKPNKPTVDNSVSDTLEKAINLDNLPENMYINKDGEVRIKPNYKAIAEDWLSKNFSYVNMLYNEKTITENGREKFLIPKDKLPEDVETWKEIGKILLSQANIKFYIDKKGIIVKNKINKAVE